MVVSYTATVSVVHTAKTTRYGRSTVGAGSAETAASASDAGLAPPSAGMATSPSAPSRTAVSTPSTPSALTSSFTLTSVSFTDASSARSGAGVAGASTPGFWYNAGENRTHTAGATHGKRIAGRANRPRW